MDILPRYYGHTVLTFYGGRILPFGLLPDIVLAVIPIFLLIALKIVLKKRGIGGSCLTILIGTSFLLFLPNTTYLMLEPKHLFFVDGIADNPSLGAYIGFGAIGMLGMLLNIVIVLKTAQGRVTQTNILCLACACGATLGMNGLNSIDAYIRPLYTVYTAFWILLDWKWLLFTIILFVLLACIVHLAYKLTPVKSLL